MRVVELTRPGRGGAVRCGAADLGKDDSFPFYVRIFPKIIILSCRKPPHYHPPKHTMLSRNLIRTTRRSAFKSYQLVLCRLKWFLYLLIPHKSDPQQSPSRHFPDSSRADMLRKLVSSSLPCSIKYGNLINLRGERLGSYWWWRSWICRRHQGWTRGIKGAYQDITTTIQDSTDQYIGCVYWEAWNSRRNMSQRRLYPFESTPQQLTSVPPNSPRHEKQRHWCRRS